MRKKLSLVSGPIVFFSLVFVIGGCATNTAQRDEQLKAQVKSELKPVLRAELRAEMRMEIRRELTNQLMLSRNELTTQLKPQIKTELKPEIKNELKPEIKSELKMELQTEMKKAVAVAESPNTPAEVKGNSPATLLFNGRTLDGWIPLQSNVSSVSGADFIDFDAFAKKLLAKSDPVSAFLNSQLEDGVKADLASYSSANDNAKVVKTSVVRSLNKIISGKTSLYDVERFQGVQLRPEVQKQLKKVPKGQALARFNKMLIEDAYPQELTKSTTVIWVVKDDVIASTGGGRGVLYTKDDYSHFRLTFQVRHISGKPDHQAGILLFCTRPAEGDKPLESLGGILFQVPNGGHWDYRPGQNKVADDLFTTVGKVKYDAHEWSQVEILADAKTGSARMAVAQPPGTKAVEVVDFKMPESGKIGPIALQLHNGGLFDEYKDLKIEVDPSDNELITAKDSFASNR